MSAVPVGETIHLELRYAARRRIDPTTVNGNNQLKGVGSLRARSAQELACWLARQSSGSDSPLLVTSGSKSCRARLNRPSAQRKIVTDVVRGDYLLARQPSELERLRLQAIVWEPTGRQLLSKLGDGSGRRALDVGCGALGWLRILSEWVRPSGHVVGADIDQNMLNAARTLLDEEGISNVQLVGDDLFASKLEPQSFDLVHARFVIAPLGRGREQIDSDRRLLRRGGSLVLEEWDQEADR